MNITEVVRANRCFPFSNRFKEWNAVHKTITVRFHAFQTNHGHKDDVQNSAHRSFYLLTIEQMFAIIEREHLFST